MTVEPEAEIDSNIAEDKTKSSPWKWIALATVIAIAVVLILAGGLVVVLMRQGTFATSANQSIMQPESDKEMVNTPGAEQIESAGTAPATSTATATPSPFPENTPFQAPTLVPTLTEDLLLQADEEFAAWNLTGALELYIRRLNWTPIMHYSILWTWSSLSPPTQGSRGSRGNSCCFGD